MPRGSIPWRVRLVDAGIIEKDLCLTKRQLPLTNRKYDDSNGKVGNMIIDGWRRKGRYLSWLR